VRILATDIAPSALARVAAARYHGRAINRVPPSRQQRWLLPTPSDPGTFEVRPDLRACVEPRRHNLVRDPAPPPGEGKFDLIVCRNVLIYFEPDQVRHVVAGLERALTLGGTMVLGAADRLVAHVPGLTQRTARALPAPRGDAKSALHTTATVLADDPLDPEALYVRGVAYLSAGDAEAAVRTLRRALYVAPRMAPAAFSLGRAHEQTDSHRAAARAYRQALGADGLDPDTATACRARLAALDRSVA
jgi:tetratricopeptide (TPR) repeat protein